MVRLLQPGAGNRIECGGAVRVDAHSQSINKVAASSTKCRCYQGFLPCTRDSACCETAPTCGPAFASAPDRAASSSERKNVYDSVTAFTSAVSGSLAIAGSTQNVSGNCMSWFGASVCSLKQKHAVLWKYFAALSGV